MADGSRLRASIRRRGDREVLTVKVPASLTKKEQGYTTFCHPEAMKFLAEHLRELEKRGFDVESRDFILFYNPRSRTRFYRVNSVEVAWNRILDRLGLDDRMIYAERVLGLGGSTRSGNSSEQTWRPPVSSTRRSRRCWGIKTGMFALTIDSLNSST